MNILKILLSLIFLLFTIHSSNAWLGLFAQNGDIIDVTKWNEMITELHTKIDQTDITGTGNIDVTQSGSGVVISFTGAITAEPIPYISSDVSTIPVNTSENISIEGTNFQPNSVITIPGWGGTINSISINSPTQFDIDLTAGVSTGSYDMVISNGLASNTLWAGNGVNQISVIETPNWFDLRLGGDTFTDGNGAGNDIRYHTTMSMTRDANGMYFSGANPWSGWVKFESLSWTRGNNKTLEWIFTAPTGAMMIGIGSTATNETNTAQYAQAEVEGYFQNATTLWGLYGNNGTVGAIGNQSSSLTISGCASQVFKERFTNDGTVGSSVFTLYCLPSSDPADWDNVSNIIGTITLGGTLNPNETTLMPFIIPRDADAQRFIAVKVD